MVTAQFLLRNMLGRVHSYNPPAVRGRGGMIADNCILKSLCSDTGNNKNVHFQYTASELFITK
jgi:hypothetical protein